MVVCIYSGALQNFDLICNWLYPKCVKVSIKFYTLCSQNCDGISWWTSVTKLNLWRNSVTNGRQNSEQWGFLWRAPRKIRHYLWRNPSQSQKKSHFNFLRKLWRNFPSQFKSLRHKIFVTKTKNCHGPPFVTICPSQFKLWSMELWRTIFRHNSTFFVTISIFFRHFFHHNSPLFS